MGTCRGKDAKHLVSTGKIVQTIGKCIGIMGGRMPFAPTNMILRCTNTSLILEILKILIQDMMPSTSFNGSHRGELNSPFFNHYLSFIPFTMRTSDHPSI